MKGPLLMGAYSHRTPTHLCGGGRILNQCSWDTPHSLLEKRSNHIRPTSTVEELDILFLNAEKKPRGKILVSLTSASSQLQRPKLQTSILLPEGPHTVATLIDSESDVSISDGEVAHQLRLGRELLLQSVPAWALDRHVLGTVTHRTSPVRLLIFGNHPSIHHKSWLRLHNPTLNGLLELFESGVPLVTKDACSKHLCLFILPATSGLPIDWTPVKPAGL